MPVFVAVVVLGLVFFLSCLLAIHWDERRRRRHPTDKATRELTPLEVIPTNARTQPYRRLILLPAHRTTPSARPLLNDESRSTGRRAVGGSTFTDLP